MAPAIPRPAQHPPRPMFLLLGALLPSRPSLRHIRKAARGRRHTAVPLLASEMIPVPGKEFRMAPATRPAQQPPRPVFLHLGAFLPSRPPQRHIREAARKLRRTAMPFLVSETIPVPEKECQMASPITRTAQQPPRPMFLWSGARRPSRPPQRHLRSRRNQKMFTLALHY